MDLLAQLDDNENAELPERHLGIHLNVATVFNEDDRTLELFGNYPTSLTRIFPLFYFGINARF